MNTPETDANTWSDSSEGVLFKVVSVEFARRLERERDEAKNKMADALQEVDLRTLDLERMKDKYATEATEHMLAVNKLCGERDEANEELSKKYVEYDQLFDEAEKIRIERDEAREEVKLLKAILDLIKKDVS